MPTSRKLKSGEFFARHHPSHHPTPHPLTPTKKTPPPPPPYPSLIGILPPPPFLLPIKANQTLFAKINYGL